MWNGWRCVVGLLAAFALAALTACGGVTAGPGGTDPTPSPPPLPADQVVFSATSTPGFTPVVYHALTAPTLAIYGDGRVVIATSDPYRGAVPAAYAVHRVDPAAVARFVAEVGAAGLVEKSTDYGQPMVTDLGSLLVTLRGAQGERSVSVYAFAEQFDRGLSAAQKQSRQRLRDTLAQANALAEQAPGETFVAERVLVIELEQTAGSSDPVPPWPGPDPASFLQERDGSTAWRACGELTGDAADTVYRAAQDNPNQFWRVDGKVRQLVVNPLPLSLTC